MTPEERKAFLKDHRLAVVGVDRKDDAPQLSPIYYVMDGDDLLISTTETRAKTPAVRRAGRVSVCILGEQMPFPYLTVYGRATIEEEGAVDLMMRVGEAMTGNPLSESTRSVLEERAMKEQRVVRRVTPESYYP